MDPSTLTAAAVALLVPYAKKAAESFAGEVGKAVFEKTTALWDWIKSRFTKGEPSSDVFQRFEKAPEKYQPYLEDLLTEQLATDSAFSSELDRRIREIKAMAPTLKVVQEMEKAEKVTGARIKELTRGNVEVNQKIKDAKDVTGADIEKM
jgi:hypothetical protein